MEDRPVVEAVAALLPGAGVDPLALALGQLGEVGDGLGRVVGEELHLDVAVVGLQGGVELLGHGASSRPRAGVTGHCQAPRRPAGDGPSSHGRARSATRGSPPVSAGACWAGPHYADRIRPGGSPCPAPSPCARARAAPVADATKDWAAPKVETAKDWAAPKVETAKDWAAPKVESGRRQGQERRAARGGRRGDRGAGRVRAGAHRGGLPRQRRPGRPQGRGRGSEAQEAPHPQAVPAGHRPRRGLRRLEGLGVPAAEQRPGLAVDVGQQHRPP